MGLQPKSIVLILARELAANVATPMFLLDREGTLVYFNEPAEPLFGAPFAAVGEVPMAELALRLAPEDVDGTRVSRQNAAPAMALLQQRPAHQILRVTGLDGVRRTVEVTAFPLFVKADEFAGAVAIFWEAEGAGAADGGTMVERGVLVDTEGGDGAGSGLGL